MATVKIVQQPLMDWNGELLLVRPKPTEYQRRVQVTVPDSVVLAKEEQPVLDAYALAKKKPEWVGKSLKWYNEEAKLGLGFILVSMDVDHSKKRGEQIETKC